VGRTETDSDLPVELKMILKGFLKENIVKMGIAEQLNGTREMSMCRRDTGRHL
jgi:hypothetical protein